MKISLSIPEEFTVTNHGYGVISREIVLSLQRLGHTVPYRDNTAQVQLNIGQPYHWMWANRDQYKIGMVAWESTKIPDNWKAPMRFADEIWTPSPLVAKWYEAEGFPVTKVYEHGVDPVLWSPKLRRTRPEVPIRFLHIGEPAPRKGGQMVYDAFKEVFGNDPAARLTIKAHGHSTVRGKNSSHPYKELSNVKVIANEATDDEMAGLVKQHDVLVYPSYGEGFGLIPLQAMVTGAPVICTESWAPYSDLLLPGLRLKSMLGDSPWPVMHPGKVFHPDFDDLKAKMVYAAENLDTLGRQAHNLVPFVQKRYDWDRLTANAFDHVVAKFDS